MSARDGAKRRSAFYLAQCRAIFAKRILRARAVKGRMKNGFAPSRFAAVEAHGFAVGFAQAEFISAEHFNRKGSQTAQSAVSAPVRAVEVSGGAANFAQAEFISAEHFNRKGSQTAQSAVWEIAFRRAFCILREKQGADFCPRLHSKPRRECAPRDIPYSTLYRAHQHSARSAECSTLYEPEGASGAK